MPMKKECDTDARSVIDTLEATILLFAICCVVLGTIAGIGIAGLARSGCP
jgi:hypothetical protein